MSQGEQKTDQVYELRRYFRSTSMGGVSKTMVFMVKNNNEVIEIMPRFSYRSRSRRHGEDVWYLSDGKYVVVDISRSNNVAKPYEVVVWCYEVQNGTAVRREVATFHENSIEDALAIVRMKLVYQC